MNSSNSLNSSSQTKSKEFQSLTVLSKWKLYPWYPWEWAAAARQTVHSTTGEWLHTLPSHPSLGDLSALVKNVKTKATKLHWNKWGHNCKSEGMLFAVGGVHFCYISTCQAASVIYGWQIANKTKKNCIINNNNKKIPPPECPKLMPRIRNVNNDQNINCGHFCTKSCI